MPLLTTPYAELDLIRQPEQANDPLQAFDAADEYLLAQLHAQAPDANCRVLVLNDSFGAVAASLAGKVQVTSSGDSHLAHMALEKNLARNGLPFDSVPFVPASEHWQGPFDRVLLRVPKTLALLEEQLIRLQGQLAPAAQVIAGAMVKHLPRAAGDLLEKYIGPVQASLAQKKARLLTATLAERPLARSPYPSRYRLDTPALELLNHANVFCREGLDIGTRAFLPHLPRDLGRARVADLGCGNGVLAIASALANPDAEYTLVDESYMAVQSARENWRAPWVSGRPPSKQPTAWPGSKNSRWMWCSATRRSTSNRWLAIFLPGACSSRHAKRWWWAGPCTSWATATWAITASWRGCSVGWSR